MASVDDDIKLVRELIAWAETNPNQIGKKIGVANTTINRFANGTAKSRLARETMTKLREAYPGFPPFVTIPPTNAVVVPMEGASQERMREELPVFGTTLGAARIVDGEAVEQTMLNSGEILTYVKRPPILNGNAKAYALYVQGSSMHPAHRDGKLILAEKGKPVRVGDDVVVYLRSNGDESGDERDDGERSRTVLIKTLVRRTAQYVELHQYTPELTFRINAAEVLRIDRVLTLDDLLS